MLGNRSYLLSHHLNLTFLTVKRLYLLQYLYFVSFQFCLQFLGFILKTFPSLLHMMDKSFLLILCYSVLLLYLWILGKLFSLEQCLSHIRPFPAPELRTLYCFQNISLALKTQHGFGNYFRCQFACTCTHFFFS